MLCISTHRWRALFAGSFSNGAPSTRSQFVRKYNRYARWTSQRTRKFLEAAQTEGVNLYNLSQRYLTARKAITLKGKYGSIPAIILTEYPDHHWQVWRFQSNLNSWWSDLSAKFSFKDPIATTVVREYLETLDDGTLTKFLATDSPLTEEQQQTLEIWARRHLHSTNITHLAYLGGIVTVLTILRSEDSRSSTAFSITPKSRSYWSSLQNQREYLLFLKDLLGGEYESLYKVSKALFYQTGGAKLLPLYNYSPSNVVISVLKEHTWYPWRFANAPRGWYDNLRKKFAAREPHAISQVQQMLQEIGQRVGITSLAQWQNNPHLDPMSLAAISKIGSLYNVLRTAYPHHTWNFTHVDPTYDSVRVNCDLDFSLAQCRRAELDNLMATLGGTFSSFYSLQYITLLKVAGGKLLRRFSNSIPFLIQTEYPEHRWEWWRFANSKSNTWFLELRRLLATTDPVARAVFLDYYEYLCEQLNISSPEDWHRISLVRIDSKLANQVRLLGGLQHVRHIANSFCLTSYDNDGNTYELISPQWNLKKSVITLLDVPA